MSRTARVFAFSACLLGGGLVMAESPSEPAIPAPAQAEIPEAAELFERHIEAMGGEEAVRSMRNRVGSGTFELDGHHSVRRLSTWAEAPDKLHFKIDDPLSGHSIEICTDGETTWERQGDTLEQLTGPREVQFAEAAVFYGEADYKTKYAEMKTVGAADLAGDECWVVQVQSHEGRVRQLFFSKQTGLFVAERSTVAVKSQTGAIMGAPVQVFLRDYKEIEGVRWPMTQVMLYLGGENGNEILQTVTQRLRKLEINKEGFDHDFSPPSDLPPAEEGTGGQG